MAGGRVGGWRYRWLVHTAPFIFLAMPLTTDNGGICRLVNLRYPATPSRAWPRQQGLFGLVPGEGMLAIGDYVSQVTSNFRAVP